MRQREGKSKGGTSPAGSSRHDPSPVLAGLDYVHVRVPGMLRKVLGCEARCFSMWVQLCVTVVPLPGLYLNFRGVRCLYP